MFVVNNIELSWTFELSSYCRWVKTIYPQQLLEVSGNFCLNQQPAQHKQAATRPMPNNKDAVIRINLKHHIHNSNTHLHAVPTTCYLMFHLFIHLKASHKLRVSQNVTILAATTAPLSSMANVNIQNEPLVTRPDVKKDSTSCTHQFY